MQEASAPLLDGGDVKKPSPSRAGRYVAGVLFCLGSVALYDCVSYHRKLILPEQFSSLTEGWGEAKCYKNTGGTCYMAKCDPERKAVCTSGRCYCESGCVGADGMCRPDVQQYELVASNFRLRNVWWKDQYLYAARTWFMEQLRTTQYKGSYADTWNLYRVPGPTWTPYGSSLHAMNGHHPQISVGAGMGYLRNESQYILSPVEFPEFAAAIANNKMTFSIPIGGDAKNNQEPLFYLKVGSMYAVSLYHLTRRHLLANSVPFDPSTILNGICKPRNQKTAIEINGLFGTASWYVHTASWLVYGWIWNDPKEGGYWEMESESGTPIDMPFPECKSVWDESS